MASRMSRVLVALTLNVVLIGCLGSSQGTQSNNSNNNSASITSISLKPQNGAVTLGKTLQFSAQATYSDGSSKDITASAVWQTNNTSLASVSAGKVTGVQAGVVTVRVGAGSVTASTLLNVTHKQFSNASLSGSYEFS